MACLPTRRRLEQQQQRTTEAAPMPRVCDGDAELGDRLVG
jgi:hypothetical protein